VFKQFRGWAVIVFFCWCNLTFVCIGELPHGAVMRPPLKVHVYGCVTSRRVSTASEAYVSGRDKIRPDMGVKRRVPSGSYSDI
jgi:hypothetical protein